MFRSNPYGCVNYNIKKRIFKILDKAGGKLYKLCGFFYYSNRIIYKKAAVRINPPNEEN